MSTCPLLGTTGSSLSVTFGPHKNPLEQVLVFSPFYSMRKLTLRHVTSFALGHRVSGPKARIQGEQGLTVHPRLHPQTMALQYTVTGGAGECGKEAGRAWRPRSPECWFLTFGCALHSFGQLRKHYGHLGLVPRDSGVAGLVCSLLIGSRNTPRGTERAGEVETLRRGWSTVACPPRWPQSTSAHVSST